MGGSGSLAWPNLESDFTATGDPYYGNRIGISGISTDDTISIVSVVPFTFMSVTTTGSSTGTCVLTQDDQSSCTIKVTNLLSTQETNCVFYFSYTADTSSSSKMVEVTSKSETSGQTIPLAKLSLPLPTDNMYFRLSPAFDGSGATQVLANIVTSASFTYSNVDIPQFSQFVLAAYPAAHLRYRFHSDCVSADNEVVFTVSSTGSLVAAADISRTGPQSCSTTFSVATTDATPADKDSFLITGLSVRLRVGVAAVFPSAATTDTFSVVLPRMDLALSSADVPPQLAGITGLVFSILVPFTAGESIFINLPAGVEPTDTTCANDPNLFSITARSPTRIHLVALQRSQGYDAILCQFNVVLLSPHPVTDVPAVLEVPALGHLARLPSPIVTLDTNTVFTAALQTLPHQGTTATIMVSFTQTEVVHVDHTFTIPYVAPTLGRHPQFAASCLDQTQQALATVAADLLHYGADKAPQAVLKVAFSKQRDSARSACTIAVQLNDAEQFYLLRPHGPTGYTEPRAQPYGPTVSPMFARDAITERFLPSGEYAITIRFPEAVLTDTRWVLGIFGGPTSEARCFYDSPDAGELDPADLLTFSRGTGVLDIEFKTRSDGPVEVPYPVTCAETLATSRLVGMSVFATELVSGQRVAEFLHTKHASAAVSLSWTGDDVDYLMTDKPTASRVDVSFDMSLSGLVTGDEQMVFVVLDLPIDMTELTFSCANVVVKSSDTTRTTLAVMGGSGSCRVRGMAVIGNDSVPPTDSSTCLISTDNVVFDPIHATIRFPGIFPSSSVALSTSKYITADAETRISALFGGLLPQDGDTVSIVFSTPVVVPADTLCMRGSVEVMSCSNTDDKSLLCRFGGVMPAVCEFTATFPRATLQLVTADIALTRVAGDVIRLRSVAVGTLAFAAPEVVLEPSHANAPAQLTLNTSMDALAAGDVIALDFQALPDADPRLVFLTHPCALPGTDEVFCEYTVTRFVPSDNFFHVVAELEMKDNVPDLVDDTLQLSASVLLLGRILFPFVGVSVHRNDVLITGMANIFTPAPSLSYMCLFAPGSPLSLVYFSSLSALKDLTITGLTLPPGTQQLTFHRCGADRQSGTAAVTQDEAGAATITMPLEAIGGDGWSCHLLLPADYSAAELITATATAVGSDPAVGAEVSEFPSAGDAFTASVSAQPLLVGFTSSLEFTFSPVLADSFRDDAVFTFSTDLPIAGKSVACDGFDAVILEQNAAADTLPHTYLVAASASRPSGEFIALKCSVTFSLSLAVSASDHEYSIGGLTLAGQPIDAPATTVGTLRHPQPRVTAVFADETHLDFSVYEMYLDGRTPLQMAFPATLAEQPVAFIDCSSAPAWILDDGSLMLQFPSAPLSASPTTIRCFVGLRYSFSGVEATFPNYHMLPSVTMPTLATQPPSLEVTVAAGDSVQVGFKAYVDRVYRIDVHAQNDKLRIADFSGTCGSPVLTNALDHFLYTFNVHSVPVRDRFECSLTIKLLLSSLGDAVSMGIRMDDSPSSMIPLRLPAIMAQPNVAYAAVHTTPDFTQQVVLRTDLAGASALMVTRLWDLSSHGVDRLFLDDHSQAYMPSSDRTKLKLTLPEDAVDPVYSVPLNPRRGGFGWTVESTANRFSLYINGVEYPGLFAPPTFAPTVLVSQLTQWLPGQPVTLQATLATPTLDADSLTISFLLELLPVKEVVGCSIEGYWHLHSYDSSDGMLIVSWVSTSDYGMSSGAGVHPVLMPHITAQCTILLESSDVLAGSSTDRMPVTAQFSTQHLARGSFFASGVGHMLPPSALPMLSPIYSIAFNRVALFSCKESQQLSNTFAFGLRSQVPLLQDAQIGIAQQTVRQAVDGSRSVVVDFISIARDGVDITATDVELSSARILKSFQFLGYTVSGAGVVQEPRDGLCATQCGAGCYLCHDGSRCSWASECISGGCVEGVCATVEDDNPDETYFAMMIVAIGSMFVVTVIKTLKKALQRSRRRDWQRKRLVAAAGG